MFKIECDDPSDLVGLMRGTIDAKVEARVAQDALYKEQDKCYTLRDEVANLKRELSLVKMGSPQRANQEAAIQSMIAAVKSGNKISAIKVIREMTGLSLKEAKDLFEAGYDGLKVA